MSAGIFISYRRQESLAEARAIYERLMREFGSDQVFIDLEGLDYGVDFVDSLERQLEQCHVLLALMGPDWSTAVDQSGNRRLNDSNDFVRIELRTALQRGIRVVPVLLNGARMPASEELPADLQSLARRQALELDFRRFEADIARLNSSLGRILNPPAALPEQKGGGEQRAQRLSSPSQVSSQPARQILSPPVQAEPGLSRKKWLVGGVAAAVMGVVLAGALSGSKSEPSPVLADIQSAEPTAAGVADPNAMAVKGENFYYGRNGVDKDEVQAAKWYRAAAEAGNALGQYSLGHMYRNGEGNLPKSDVDAAKWFSMAAEKGNAEARFELGVMYENGEGGLPKDEARAVELYRFAAELGNAAAQNNLGVAFWNGQGGLSRSLPDAVQWFQAAAGQGDPFGQANLAEMTKDGLGGLTKDRDEAVRLYRLAAKQDHEGAIEALKQLGEKP